MLALLDDISSPIRAALNRSDISDLCINGPGRFYTETPNGWECHEATNITETWLRSFAKSTAKESGGVIDERRPLLSTTLYSGERVQIVFPPAAADFSVTIRRPSEFDFTLDDLEKTGAFSNIGTSVHGTKTLQEAQRILQRHGVVPFFRFGVRERLNFIVSGATGSGKTTLENSLIQEIPAHERLISIEDADELKLPLDQNNVRLYYSRDKTSVSPVTAKDLLVSCLRMKPDRIMLAELRDEEAYFYLRNVNSGHPGSITTLHANDPRAAIDQLILMIRQSNAGSGMERADILQLVTSLVDVIIQMHKRQVTEIYFPKLANDDP